MADSSSRSSLLSMLVSAKKRWFNHSAYSASLITYTERENIGMYLCWVLNSASKVFSWLLLLSTSWTYKCNLWQCIAYMLQDVQGFSTMFRVLDYSARLLICTLHVPEAAWQISIYMEGRQGNGHSALSLLLLTCCAATAAEPLHSWVQLNGCTATQPELSLCIKLCQEASCPFQSLWNFTSEVWI